MQKLRQWFEARADRQQRIKLVDRVAERSQTAVWRLVYPAISNMGFREACGYVRARSAIIVRRELRLAGEGLDAQQHDRVREVAMGRVVRSTMKELVSQQSAPTQRAA